MWHVWAFLLPSGLVYLTNSQLSILAISGRLPELSLIALVYFSNSRNRLIGQLGGLATGLTIDFLSAAPLGFFTFIYALIGFLAGSSKGKIYVDPLFTPLLLVLVAMLIRSLLVFTLASLFGYSGVRDLVFGSGYFIELIYTLVLTPIFFGLYSLLDRLFPKKRKGGYQD